MATMTVEEKVGQLIQADIGSIVPSDLQRYPVGSILAGGSSGPGGQDKAPAAAWLALANNFQAAATSRTGSQIPLLIGIDAVHGHTNIPGATVFPHNIGLGAAGDPELVEAIAGATAQEVAATGFNWTFAPTLAVPRDDRWGRTYEGFSEDPELQRRLAGPYVLGLQGPLRDGEGLAPGHVMGSAKHFLADGGTLDGRDRGDAPVSERELIDIHLSGYPQAIDAGVLSIMVSFSGWNGVKHTGNRSLLTDVLRGPLGFDGLVIGDWDAHAFVPGCRPDSCAAAVNAGVDMFMAANSWKALYDNTLAQVKAGQISTPRLDEAVARILRVKLASGAFEPQPLAGNFTRLGAPEHRALAREAVRQSLVLLKNDGGVLPLKPGARVLVAGSAADDIATAAGGWTFSWQGTGNTNADFPGGQSIWSGLDEALRASGGRAELSPDGAFTQRPDAAVVVFGEAPYAEFYGDLDTLDFAPVEGLELLRSLKAQGIPTIAVFLSGRPLWVNPEINAADAFVAAWLPGSEGGGVADVLVAGADGRARHDFSGRLSFSWPRTAGQTPQNRGDAGYDPLFPFGFGLTYRDRVGAPALSEDPEAPEASGPPRLFASGRFVAPWSLTLQDERGSFRVEQPGRASSPAGRLTVEPVDGAAQESARRFQFVGAGGVIAIGGPPTDLGGDFDLTFRYRIDAPAAGPVRLLLGNAAVYIGELLTSSDWDLASIPLSCFVGVDRSRISTVKIAAPAGLSLSIEDARLTPSQGAACPVQTGPNDGR
jgi:beta-glucosidase